MYFNACLVAVDTTYTLSSNIAHHVIFLSMNAADAEHDKESQGQEIFYWSHHVDASQAIRIVACVDSEELVFYTINFNSYQNTAFSNLIRYKGYTQLDKNEINLR